MARRSIRKRRHLSGGYGWSNYFHHVFTEEDSQAPDFEEKLALKRASVEKMGWVFSWSVGLPLDWTGIEIWPTGVLSIQISSPGGPVPLATHGGRQLE